FMIFGVSVKCLSVARIYPNVTSVWTNRRTVARDSPVASAASVRVIVGVCPKASMTSSPRANDCTNSAELVGCCINEFDIGFCLQFLKRQPEQCGDGDFAGIGQLKNTVIGV